jgi:hypothetical protein
MKTPKHIEPRNTKGQWHGYQEWYKDDKMLLRGTYKHGKDYGYEEHHQENETNFYIK